MLYVEKGMMDVGARSEKKPESGRLAKQINNPPLTSFIPRQRKCRQSIRKNRQEENEEDMKSGVSIRFE
jgi:hypothetical protein